MLSEYQVETIEKDKLSPGKHQKSIPNLGNKKSTNSIFKI